MGNNDELIAMYKIKYEKFKNISDELRLDDAISPCNAFVNFVKEALPDGGTVVEVGVWQGETSCKYIPFVMEKRGKVILVDWFKGNPGHPAGLPHGFDGIGSIGSGSIEENLKHNIDVLGVNSQTTILSGDSAECAKDIPNNSVDIVFIDADHTHDKVLADLTAYFPKLKKSGILTGHDLNHKGVISAVTEFMNKINTSSKIKIELDVTRAPNGVAVSQADIKYENRDFVLQLEKRDDVGYTNNPIYIIRKV